MPAKAVGGIVASEEVSAFLRHEGPVKQVLRLEEARRETVRTRELDRHHVAVAGLAHRGVADAHAGFLEDLPLRPCLEIFGGEQGQNHPEPAIGGLGANDIDSAGLDIRAGKTVIGSKTGNLRARLAVHDSQAVAGTEPLHPIDPVFEDEGRGLDDVEVDAAQFSDRGARGGCGSGVGDGVQQRGGCERADCGQQNTELSHRFDLSKHSGLFAGSLSLSSAEGQRKSDASVKSSGHELGQKSSLQVVGRSDCG